jgi:hypothetical protein
VPDQSHSGWQNWIFHLDPPKLIRKGAYRSGARF